MAHARKGRADFMRARRQSASRGVRPRIARDPDAQGLPDPGVRMTLRVLEPGLYTLVVDFGRPHHRSLGVPIGGAADRTSLSLGNALVGNPPDAAALEINLAGPTLEAGCNLACVVYGAPFALRSDRQELSVGKTFTFHAGERLRI